MMNRRIATWATIAIAAFSLTACSGAPSTPQTPSPEPSTSAPADPAPSTEQTTPETTPPASETSGQSLSEACLEPSAKIVEASAELAKVSEALAKSDGKDAKAMVDALKEMGKYFGTLAESSVNPEVKESLTGIAKAYADLAVAYGKLLIDEDFSAAADATRALADLQESVSAFQKLCTP